MNEKIKQGCIASFFECKNQLSGLVPQFQKTKSIHFARSAKLCSFNKVKITATSRQTLDSPNIILGRERFEKFSAVEGIYLDAEDRLTFAEMDSKKLSNDERRKLIMARLKEAT